MISQGFFTAPEFPFPDEFVRQTAAKLGLPFDLHSLCVYDREIELALLISGLEELDSQGFDFREILGRSDDPPEFWRRPVSLIYASGKFASEWRSASLTLGALAFLTTTRCRNATKDQRAIVLSDVKATKRRKVDVTSVNGLSLDDDGVIGRDQIAPKYLLIAFGTASDGKDQDLIDCDAYRAFTKTKNAPIPPTDASAEAFLNRHGDQGNAYREVKVVRDPQVPGKPLLSHDKHGVASYVVTFTPQQRTRYLVPFVRPLQGELLNTLLALPKGFERFCQRIEYEVLGRNGTDAACFEPVRVGYLPSGDNGTFYHAILGSSELIDPIPYAKQVIAKTEPRAVRKLTVTPLHGDVPEHLRKTLKGVRLASLIADNYPELVHRDNGLEPLIMRCCPFCDGHSVKRGQADNSLYCYDPNETPYPTMRCHHRSCARRKTDEFVNALVDCGDLDREAVYEDSQYRDIYVDEPAERGPAISRNHKILW